MSNDVETGANAAHPIGEGGTGMVYLLEVKSVPTGDLSGCNAGGAGAGQATNVSIQSSAPAKVSIGAPGYVLVEACDNTGTTPKEGNKTFAYSVVGGAVGDVVYIYTNATAGKTGSRYVNDTFTVTILAPPAPTNTPPTDPGAPVADSSPNRGRFNLSWTASTDNESLVTYALQHKDADDAAYSTVAAGLATNAHEFAHGNPEAEGTWTYRVNATDAGSLSSGWSPASSAVKVDKTAPNAPSASADRTAEYAGAWWKDAVTVTFGSDGDATLADGSAGSGVASVSAAQTFTTNGAHVARGNATDNVGWMSKDTTLAVNVDATAPDLVVSGCPSAPVLRNAAVSASWSAWDNQSGLVGAASGTFALATGALGPQTTNKTVQDNVGHETSLGCAYTVIGYTYDGFYSPLAPDNTTWNGARAGSTLPLKFNVAIGGEAQTNTTYGGQPIVSFASKKVTCPGGATEDPVDFVVNATGGTSLRYDPVSQQFVYNWKTPTTKGCYELSMPGLDGSRLLARFSLK